MREEVLHFIWRFKRFDHHDLKTTKGDDLEILEYGIWNHNSGPDFLNASIKINGTIWHGSIEIHTKASEWYKHSHETDPNYYNVILHVVYLDDSMVTDHYKNPLNTLELNGRIHLSFINNYTLFTSQRSSIPCANQITGIDPQFIKIYMQSLLIRRLERKYNRIKAQLTADQGNWDLLCIRMLAKYLGATSNKEAFKELIDRTPVKLILRCASNLKLLEALLFGQAGFLHSAKDDYTKALKQEYQFLKTKYGLEAMTGKQWNFGRIRPSSYPSLRIAILCSILHNKNRLFSRIIYGNTLQEYYQILNVACSEYWNDHFIAAKPSKPQIKKLGRQARDQILINVFIPILFSYAKTHQNEALIQHCLHLYSQIRAEKNAITKNWQSIGINTMDAGESQAMIELKTEFCEHLKCLNCQIGTKILFE